MSRNAPTPAPRRHVPPCRGGGREPDHPPRPAPQPHGGLFRRVEAGEAAEPSRGAGTDAEKEHARQRGAGPDKDRDPESQDRQRREERRQSQATRAERERRYGKRGGNGHRQELGAVYRGRARRDVTRCTRAAEGWKAGRLKGSKTERVGDGLRGSPNVDSSQNLSRLARTVGADPVRVPVY